MTYPARCGSSRCLSTCRLTAPVPDRSPDSRELLACLVMTQARPALAQASGDVVVKSPQAILMDADTGAIMFQRTADALVPPASMSKLMLLAVVFKALKNGEAKLTDEYLISENSWRKAARLRHLGDVRPGRDPGEARGADQGHHRAVG